MSDSLKFADGTTVPIIALYHPGAVNFMQASRDQIVARIAESAIPITDLKALACDAAKAAAIVHNFDQTTTGEDGKLVTTPQTQEYDSYVYLHHLNYYYESGDGAYEYELALCAKTADELQNAALKSRLAASLEG